MKRLLPSMLLVALAVSACTVRVDIGVSVNDDESGSFALFTGFDEELRQLAEQSGETIDFTQELGDVPPGWTVTEVTEDGFEGVRISVDFDSLADLQARLGELEQSGDGDPTSDLFTNFALERAGDEFRFRADLSGLTEEMTGALDGGGGEDLFSGFDPTSLFENLFQIRFRLTLPGEIGANNADSVDGNTLTWNVSLADEAATYEAVSTLGGGGLSLLLVLVAIAVIAAIAAVALAMRRRRAPAASPFGTMPPAGDPRPADGVSSSQGPLPADPFAG